VQGLKILILIICEACFLFGNAYIFQPKFNFMFIKHFITPRFFIFFLVFIFSSFYTLAQNVTLKGNVKDANGQPVAGASVILDGTKKGTITDAEGNYKLLVAQSPVGTHHTLLISYVGMQTQRIDITVSSEEVITNDFQMVNTGVLTAVTVGSRSSTVRTRIQTPVPVDDNR